jgi:hypothetical protein
MRSSFSHIPQKGILFTVNKEHLQLNSKNISSLAQNEELFELKMIQYKCLVSHKKIFIIINFKEMEIKPEVKIASNSQRWLR